VRERCEKVVLQLAGLPKKKTHCAYLPNLAEIEGEIELFKNEHVANQCVKALKDCVFLPPMKNV